MGRMLLLKSLYQPPIEDEVGLFGVVEDASIDNLVVVDIDITGKSYTGGLIGSSEGGIISNSTASGNVEGESDYVGGLVGHNSGYIFNSTVSGNVEGESDYVGGLVGHNQDIFLIVQLVEM